MEAVIGQTVLFADDSAVARKQIERTLTALNLKYIGLVNGLQAQEELEKLSEYAHASGKKVSDFVNLVITDVEMPEVDGYILCKYIKSDPRFNDIPVLMHSSLSTGQNQQLGKMVGVDAYVSKFEPKKLADIVVAMLQGTLPEEGHQQP